MTALIEVIQKIMEILDNKEMAKMGFCDMSKAFDTVQHHILLSKLNCYGIRGVQLLIRSYLRNRRQVVAWNGVEASEGILNCGIPQGSVLGPILFIIYTNNFTANIKAHNTCLYADDKSFIVRAKNLNVLNSQHHLVLSQIKQWFNVNKLKLNEAKTATLTFAESEERHCVKFLGVHLDSRLDCRIHTTELKKSYRQQCIVSGPLENSLTKKL